MYAHYTYIGVYIVYTVYRFSSFHAYKAVSLLVYFVFPDKCAILSTKFFLFSHSHLFCILFFVYFSLIFELLKR